jgi:hypothetical protein
MESLNVCLVLSSIPMLLMPGCNSNSNIIGNSQMNLLLLLQLVLTPLRFSAFALQEQWGSPDTHCQCPCTPGPYMPAFWQSHLLADGCLVG